MSDRSGTGTPGVVAPARQLDTDVVLDRLLVNSSDLVVVVDRDGRLRFVSAAAARILGRDPAHWIGRDVFELIHPDDLGVAAEALVTSSEGDAGVKEPLVLRVLHADNSWRHVEIVANNLMEDPYVEGLLINARDLTERFRAQANAERDRRRFEQVFEQAPIGMALVSVDGRITRANSALARMVGRPVHELLTLDATDLTVAADRRSLVDHARRLLAEDPASPEPFELRLARPDGRLTWVRVTTTVVRDDDGLPLHGIVHCENVTEQRLLREELEHRARHDALTEALNREGFRLHAQRLAATGVPFGVVVVDLDGFKSVNDAHGHAAGDELLVAVTARLRSAVKASDAVARFGGDEFVLLTAPITGPELAGIGERVRAVLDRPFTLSAGRVRVTGSVGTALAAPGQPVEAILAKADAAAYRAKRRGGNAVMPADERGVLPASPPAWRTPLA